MHASRTPVKYFTISLFLYKWYVVVLTHQQSRSLSQSSSDKGAQTATAIWQACDLETASFQPGPGGTATRHIWEMQTAEKLLKNCIFTAWRSPEVPCRDNIYTEDNLSAPRVKMLRRKRIAPSQLPYWSAWPILAPTPYTEILLDGTSNVLGSFQLFSGAVLCDIASSMFIDLAREVELLDNHGVNSYRKLADERVLQRLKSSSKERKE
ncbi:hypothetical protein HGM15179_006553 [Zosterops borbonicus]|uniref:Uncharacterized protein n=1 Tax=Zosterops borbonicus TaxID=364589 RepID=A0A8K1GKF2_9PASS|nr:hypothetical protein HGM15179_006553 [Zosterops borbonicus]